VTTLFATAALGTEGVLASELSALGFRAKPGRGAVGFDASEGQELAAGMRACLHLRSAIRVLWPLAEFPATDADQLYAGARSAAWERALTARSTFAISATTSAPPPLAHAPFLIQRVKDAVCDRLRDKLGARPDVAREDPDVRLYVHVKRGRAAVGLDVSGESLHLRGYRVAQTEAPLKESLAAAVLLLAQIDGERPFVDPMCGSGTLPIEAAAIARRVAPGLMARTPREPGCARWPSFGDAERQIWRRLVEEARAAERPAPFPVTGSDRDPQAIAAAQRNAAASSVGDGIVWRPADVRALAPARPAAVIVTNPPYGERLAQAGLEGFWRGMGAHLRTLTGHRAYFLAPRDRLRWLGMRPAWEHELKNGPLDVTLARYELR
jgi:putative N6-adenine-specific DNA methylase